MKKKKHTTPPKGMPPADGLDKKGARQIDATQLALLAALLHPNACKNDDSRSALYHALTLVVESAQICEKAGDLSADNLWSLIDREPAENSGVRPLIEAYAKKCADPRLSEALPERSLDISFEEAVRQITGQKRTERAMPAFRKWLATKIPEAGIGEEMNRLRREITTLDLVAMTDGFASWWKSSRSRVNQANAKKRKAPQTKKRRKKQK